MYIMIIYTSFIWQQHAIIELKYCKLLSLLSQTKLQGYEPNLLSKYDFNIVHGYDSRLVAIGTDDPFFIDLFLHNHHITLCKG